LVTALVVTQGFIFFTLQCWVWANTSPGLADGPNAIGHRIAEELDYTLVNQLGASFSVPVLVWAFVTFRKQDVLRAS
jgi:hypothetical protein